MCTALAAPGGQGPRAWPSVLCRGGNDARLLADIEKLIKKKVELLAVEYEEDRPRGRINTGRRAWGDEDDRPATPGYGHRERREPRDYRSARSAPLDPFFSRPYEAPSADAQPAWEVVTKAVPARGVSSNIKPRRKVAALFKAIES